MTTRATGKFEIKSWDEQPYKEFGDGKKLTRATAVTTLHGDIEGEASREFLMAYTDAEHATYVGLIHVSGRIDGRAGDFVIEETGIYADGVARSTWTVVPGTATGELSGLRGNGGYQATHADYPNVPFTLDYDVE